MPRQVAQRGWIAQLRLPAGVQDGVVLRVGHFLSCLTEVFRVAADRDVVWIERGVDTALLSDGGPTIAWLKDAVAPRPITRVDEAIQCAIQADRVVGRQLCRAIQEFGDGAGFTASFSVHDDSG